MSLSNLKITLNNNRVIKQIEADDFRIKVNGGTNTDYIQVLKPLGVVLVFEAEPQDVVVKSGLSEPLGTVGSLT